MSIDPRLEMWSQYRSVYFERPLHMLSETDTDSIIQRHLTSRRACQQYIERLRLYEKDNLKYAVGRMLSLCDVNNDELCLYILEEFHNTR